MSGPENGDGSVAYVLNASALLAFSHGEEGAGEVGPLLSSSVISSVNWAEVLQRVISAGSDVRGKREDMESLGLQIHPFTADDAEATARLWATGRQVGLSMGDRACLSLAQMLGLPALTADRVWATLDLNVEVRLIR
ncbi:MAG: twitching motility protein PilT [SAR202 cluster bacterium Io17-Chloro-G2]|nr:MAG: twitching motility protein PilT [SAR202 cluster bacterium Io17-Chloro-G2]